MGIHRPRGGQARQFVRSGPILAVPRRDAVPRCVAVAVRAHAAAAAWKPASVGLTPRVCTHTAAWHSRGVIPRMAAARR